MRQRLSTTASKGNDESPDPARVNIPIAFWFVTSGEGAAGTSGTSCSVKSNPVSPRTSIVKLPPAWACSQVLVVALVQSAASWYCTTDSPSAAVAFATDV